MVDEEIYLYLDINGKLDQNFFQKPDIFFKIVNFDKEHPLIQIGNYIFQGTYEDFLGTKVFLVENEDNEPDENVFVKQTPLRLEYLCKTAKTLQLKWVKVPSDVVHLEQSELLDLKFNENYNEVLKKLEKGLLNIEDVALNTESTDVVINSINESNTVKRHTTEMVLEVDEVRKKIKATKEQKRDSTEFQSVTKPDDASDGQNQMPIDKYSILKDLARNPVKQTEDFQKVYEIDPTHINDIKNIENFAVFKQLFIQSLSSDYFPKEIGGQEFHQYVNVEKSIQEGIISETDAKQLSEQDKQALLSPINFNNFSVPMKLTYLVEQLKEHKMLLENMNAEDLRVLDQYGRTPKDRYELLKRLTKDTWYFIYSHHVSD